jgi:hypothetical protein
MTGGLECRTWTRRACAGTTRMRGRGPSSCCTPEPAAAAACGRKVAKTTHAGSSEAEGRGWPVTRHPVPLVPFGAPGYPAQKDMADQAVSCEPADRRRSGRPGGRGEPSHGRCHRAVRRRGRGRPAPGEAATACQSVAAALRWSPRTTRSTLPRLRRIGPAGPSGQPRGDRRRGRPDRG